MRDSMRALPAALLLAALAVLTAGAASAVEELPAGGSFTDDDGSVHEGTIEAVAAARITRGCNPPASDRFCPDVSVRRGQMAAFLDRALALPDTDEDFFTDDNGSIFEDSINRIAARGITLGCNPPANDLYCPDDPVRRDVMAAFLVRAFGGPEATKGPGFADAVGSIFENDIHRLAAAGVTRGCNPPVNDRYCPSVLVSRAQMATFLARALDLEPNTPPPGIDRDPSADADLGALPRSAWGAATAIESRMTEHIIEQLTVHHAGDQSAGTGPARYRSWQAWHQQRGWGDLAYHFIVGVDGLVYEARDTRYAGDTGTNYDPSGHFLVVLEGNFEVDVPSKAQLASLVRVLAWASTEFGVSPDTISGHRDHAATACPGGNLYPYVSSGDLANDVRALLGGI